LHTLIADKRHKQP